MFAIIFCIYSYIQSFWQLSQLQSSSGLNQRAISLLADSTASEPWQMLRPTRMQRSPLMVPGAESAGLVAPNMTRPVLTALRPSHTIASTGPLAMYLTKPAKKPLEDRSALWFLRSSSEACMNFMATSLNPLFSNLLMISPQRPRWTASGLIMMKVLSVFPAIVLVMVGQSNRKDVRNAVEAALK